MASKPNKHSSVLALQRVGLFLQSVVQLVFVHWMGVLDTHIDLVLFVQQKKDRLSLSEELKAGQFSNCRLDLFIVRPKKGRSYPKE